MKIGKFMYKCRQCGEIYTEMSTNKKLSEQILMDIVYGWDYISINVGIKPKMQEIHTCRNNGTAYGWGVSDLIGIKFDNE